MRKNLCWLVMAFLVFASLNSGCGGSSSSPISNNNTTQSQDVTPNNPTSPDNTPTPTPTPDTPTSPDKTPTTPDTPITPDNPSAEFDMNGSWRIDSGALHMDIPEIGKYVFPYIEGSASAPLFDISVSNNGGYYAVKLSGAGVTEMEEQMIQDLIIWEITWKFDISSAPSFLTEGGNFGDKGLLWGCNQCTHPETNYYVSTMMNTVISFRIIDNDTIAYLFDAPANNSAVYSELTLKRVQ